MCCKPYSAETDSVCSIHRCCKRWTGCDSADGRTVACQDVLSHQQHMHFREHMSSTCFWTVFGTVLPSTCTQMGSTLACVVTLAGSRQGTGALMQDSCTCSICFNLCSSGHSRESGVSVPEKLSMLGLSWQPAYQRAYLLLTAAAAVVTS